MRKHAKSSKSVPQGYHALTPTLTVKNAKKAIEFYKKAFGAVSSHEICTMPDGKIGHAELTIGDSKLMLNDEFPEMNCLAPKHENISSSLYLYVSDVDQVFKAASAAGAKILMPVQNQFWGDRQGMLVDPFGHRWSIATHTEDLTDAQIKERMEKAFAQPSGR